MRWVLAVIALTLGGCNVNLNTTPVAGCVLTTVSNGKSTTIVIAPDGTYTIGFPGQSVKLAACGAAG